MTAGVSVSVNCVIIPSTNPAQVVVAEEGPNPTYDANYAPFKAANATVVASYPTAAIVKPSTWGTIQTQDGLHPNQRGVNLIVQSIIDYLNTLGYREGVQHMLDSSAFTYTSPGAPSFVAGSATVAGAPTALTATSVNATTVTASWTAPASNGGNAIIDYTVQYRTTAGPGAWTTFAHTASTATSQNVTGLTTGTSYDFQVAAVNTVGTSAYSATSTATPAAIPQSLPGAVFADNFNRADSTNIGASPVGAFTPTFRAGSASIVSNQMKFTAYTAMYWAIGSNDYTFQSTIVGGITSNFSVDIRQGANDYQWTADGAFRDNANALVANVGTFQAGDITKVKALGSAFTFWVNGIQTGTATLATATGGVGFRADANAIVDNVSATTP
jgi:hypothetical protein